jgi:hypothetical protein
MLLLLCLNPVLSIAQNQAQLEAKMTQQLQNWEKEMRERKSYWERTTKMATSPQHKTIYVLYVNGKPVAAFRDATSCRMEIDHFRLQVERLFDRVYNEYKRGGGKVSASDHEMKREVSNQARGMCACKTENNPNYSADNFSKNYSQNTFPASTTTKDKDNSQADNTPHSTFITGSSTQYENPFDAPSARGTNAPVKPNEEKTISVNFEGIGNYLEPKANEINLNKPYLNPVQRARELEKSKRAYEIAVNKIDKFLEEKEKLEKETEMLIVKNQNGKELLSQLQKDSARLEYQEHIVWYEASDFKHKGYIRYEESKVKERENTLKTQFGMSDEEIQQLRKEAEAALKKGVPTMSLLSDLDKGDTELREELPQKIQKALDVKDAGIDIGQPIAAGIIEKAYSDAKNEISQTLEQYRKLEQRQQNEISLKQQQLTDMTTERNNLQKIFNKYGYDIVNNQDDYQIINFGNECRDVLSIKIE